jgi:hypothetical protein
LADVIALSSEVDTGSREENASKQKPEPEVSWFETREGALPTMRIWHLVQERDLILRA